MRRRATRGLSVLDWVLRRAEHEVIPLVCHLPTADGWVGWLVRPRELSALLEGISYAWVVQRPGYSGLVTRVVLLDDAGKILACMAAAREPGLSEPVEWRVILLMALLTCAEDAVGSPSSKVDAGSPICTGTSCRSRMAAGSPLRQT